jgi:nucleoside-diphosphate-sugar epimerase
MVDVRDLVAFYLKLLEERRGGTYNAAGPREALTMEGFLDQAIKALGSTSRLSLAETVKDTLAWWATAPEERRAKPRFIITPEIEAKALADWKRK